MLFRSINLELLLDKMAYWVTWSRQIKSKGRETFNHDDTMAECIEKIGGNKHLFLKILSVFVEKHRDDDVQVIQMLQKGNNVDAKKLIHSLKGVALVVGAKKLHGTTIKLEKILLEETSLELAPLLRQFEKHLRDTISCLQRYITSSDN